MKKINRIFILISVLLQIAISISAKDKDEELLAFSIYGDNFLLSIPLPNYWMVDMNAAVRYGVNGVFFIKKYGMDETPVYINVKLYFPPKDFTLEKFESDMIKNLTDYLPDYKLTKIGSAEYSTQLNKWQYKLYDLKKKEGHGHYQQIAYMKCEEKNVFIEMYIDCIEDTHKDNNKYIKDFINCLHKMEFPNYSFKFN